MTPTTLAEHWRRRANELRPYTSAAAIAYETAATELEVALREAADQELTLSEARAESGYSERRLRELLADGTVPNAGARGRPRIRRADLPKRAGRQNGSTYDAGNDAARLLNLMGGP